MRTPQEQIEVGDDGVSPALMQHLRFPSPLEQEFREDYIKKVLPGLRGGLILLMGILLLQGVSILISIKSVPPSLTGCAVIFVLLLTSLHPRFPRIWQPCIVITFCAMDFLLLVTGHPHANGDAKSQSNAVLLTELTIVILGFVLTRLCFVWFVLGCFTVAALQTMFAATLGGLPMNQFMLGTGIFIAPSFAALMYVTYSWERGARGEFLANYRLAQLNAAERQKREQTEGMLHILNQAIGGIVHDLGNPLTSVRTGAETLRSLLSDADDESKLKIEMLDIVSEGAQMLDYLRLSLLEQTRALEGKEIPLELGPTSMRYIIEAGIHFQQPKFSSDRRVFAPHEELELQADSMKLIAVFMNLIGNALKYSDGEIKITWRRSETSVLIAVQDQGRKSSGISNAQAKELFFAFSRLAGHAQTEGTGLGLLSARNIVEAHGGEAFIEGFADGTPTTPLFTTARGRYPSMLTETFCTAFVVVLPHTSSRLPSFDENHRESTTVDLGRGFVPY
ncbi:MAG: sensor histidine kinase [Janthinobacterium lividum]